MIIYQAKKFFDSSCCTIHITKNLDEIILREYRKLTGDKYFIYYLFTPLF